MCCLIPVVANKAYNNAFPFSSGEENNMYNFCCRVFSRSKFFYRLSPRLPTRKKISRNKTKKKLLLLKDPHYLFIGSFCVCCWGIDPGSLFDFHLYAASKVMTARSRRKFFFAHQMALNFTRSDDRQLQPRLVLLIPRIWTSPLISLLINNNNLGCCCCCTFLKWVSTNSHLRLYRMFSVVCTISRRQKMNVYQKLSPLENVGYKLGEKTIHVIDWQVLSFRFEWLRSFFPNKEYHRIRADIAAAQLCVKRNLCTFSDLIFCISRFFPPLGFSALKRKNIQFFRIEKKKNETNDGGKFYDHWVLYNIAIRWRQVRL